MQTGSKTIIAAVVLFFLLGRHVWGKADRLPEPAKIGERLARYDGLIENAATKYKIDGNLIRAIIWQESSANPDSKVDEGWRMAFFWGVWQPYRLFSYGLMGVTPPAAKDVGYTGKDKDLLRPEINITYGAAYLRWLQKVNIPKVRGVVEKIWVTVNGVRMPLDLMLAIISYNTGSGNIHKDSSKDIGWRWTKKGDEYLNFVTKKWASLEGRPETGAGREF